MPQIKTVTLYSFDELEDPIKDNIISKYVQDLPGWWSDDVEERIKNEAKAIGIKDFDFSWSGFWSQGDGLSFTGSLSFKSWFYILTERLSPEAFVRLCGKLPHELIQRQEEERILWGDCRIERNSHMYCHEHTVTVAEPEAELGWNERRGFPSDNEIMIKFCEQAQKHLEEWKNDLCLRWYSELQNAYELMTERENIVDEISSRELLFTSGGKIMGDEELV